MSYFRFALLGCLGGLAVGLAGCGSSDSAAPYTVSCRTHRLPTGRIRAAVTVNNSMAVAGSPILYGPALQWVRHAYPLLLPVPVRAGAVSYIGLRVPRIHPGKALHLLLRFAPPPSPQALAVTDSSVIAASNTNPLSTAGCTITRMP